MKRLIPLVFSCALTTSAVADLAIYQYHQGEYSKSLPGIVQLANNKNAEALYYLANMNLYGYGVKQDKTQALKFMEEAATLNYLPAQIFMGNYYLNDQKNLEKAFIWFKKAADQGNVASQLYTALAYINGLGVPKDENKARSYLISSARGGVAMAQFKLAEHFLSNKSASDKKLGILWLKNSANKNFSDAMFVLGNLYLQGKVIKKDTDTGMALIKKAAELGNKDAAAMLQQTNSQDSAKSAPDNSQKTAPVAPAPANSAAATPSTTAPAPAISPWQNMMTLLTRAGIAFQNPKITPEKPGTLVPTPELVKFTADDVVKPDYELITPQNISIQDIILANNRISYGQKVPKLSLNLVKFDMPEGAKTDKEAFEILSHQAMFGHMPAQFQLGLMYAKGIYVEKNPKKAFELFMLAAEHYYLNAEFMVGYYYLTGTGVPKNSELALSYLQKAAFHGSANAQYLLGYIHEFGYRGEFSDLKDLDKAAALYNLAAQSGLPIAQYRLAELYASGKIQANNHIEMLNNLKIAYQLYKKSADQGMNAAKVNLAYFYATKNEPEDKQAYAYQVATESVKAGNKNAELLLALLYDRGIGTSQKTSKAVKIYKELVQENNPIAFFMLGTYYYLEDKDFAKAKEYLTKSASDGNVYALYNLAIITKEMKTPSSNDEFVDYLTQAADKNYQKANLLLADYYLANSTGNDALQKAANIYQQLAEKQYPDAMLKLGYMYQNGIFYSKDESKALEWYQKAAALNNPKALYLLGLMYQTGDGVARNVTKALGYYQTAAKSKFVPAMVAIGFIYEMDEHNLAQAKVWYQQAATLGSEVAKKNLVLLSDKYNQ